MRIAACHATYPERRKPVKRLTAWWTPVPPAGPPSDDGRSSGRGSRLHGPSQVSALAAPRPGAVRPRIPVRCRTVRRDPGDERDNDAWN
ncbi:hypothetical protein AMK10_16310 [Streptomyces sp. CB02058]|nr:hypothetical protein AMK10_16310 [Streptomyces sp. CB02058]